jgi:hypothetical protein
MYRGVTEKLRPEIEVEEKCSACGKKQLSSLKNSGWHRIAVYHCDDDIDISNTFRYYEVCSFECYLKQVRRSVDELEASKTARIDGMDLAFVRKLLFFYGA